MTFTAPDTTEFVPLPSLIAAHAAGAPRARAFQIGGRAIDWQTLHRHLGAVARALIAGGVRPGDTVAVAGFASLAYVECFFGILAARACVVPLPTSASVDALRSMLADSGVKWLFVDPEVGAPLVHLAGELAARGELRVVHYGEDGADGDEYTAWRAAGAASATPLPQADPQDAFNIIYSSGTTGVPKGIVHLHGMRSLQSLRKGFGLSTESRMLLSTPTYSNTTITPMLGTLAQGGTCILMRKFDAARWLAIAAAERITHTMLVPVQYQRLLAHEDFAPAALGSLQMSQSTGAPMKAALKREIVERWPGRFIDGYGLTEGGVHCYLDAHAHPDKLATVGRPAPGTDVFLLDEKGRRLPMQAGIEGEVVGRSAFMMAGYRNRPDADAEMRWFDADGTMYHRSGDVGRFDEDGFLTLLDRRKDVIISGGNNIYAADLEAVLARHPQVQEAAVIGVPSDQWGETPLALVVPRAGAPLDAQALREWANAQLGKTQRLAAVELRAELARNALGKLSKKELRAPYWRANSP